jgi:flagellar hook assembly protein FlgD
MRKILLVLFMSFSLLGMTGLSINGDSVATITIGDSITVTGTFESGDSIAEAVIRIDIDSNGVVDPNDPAIGYSYLMDGSWNDDDETKDGDMTFKTEFFSTTGNFIITSADAGGSDQGIIHVQPITSSLNISGQIIPDSAGIIVGSILLPDESELISDVTDTNGNYSINIPDSLNGRYFKIATHVTEDALWYAFGTLSDDSVLLTGSAILNDSLIPTDGVAVRGHFINEGGSPHTEPITLQFNGSFVDLMRDRRSGNKMGFAIGGSGILHLRSGSFGEDSNDWTIRVSQEHPYFMTPEIDDTIELPFPTDTVDGPPLTLFSCDTMIAGTVFVDGSQVDGEGLWAWSDSTGSAPSAGTYSTGYYKINVSSHPDNYYVGLSNYDGSLYGGDKLITPGSTGVNFYVSLSGIEEKEITTLKASPVIITASTLLEISGVTRKNAVLKIYDVTGKVVKTLPQKSLISTTASYELDAKNLVTGIFFGKIEGQAGTFKLSVIK